MNDSILVLAKAAGLVTDPVIKNGLQDELAARVRALELRMQEALRADARAAVQAVEPQAEVLPAAEAPAKVRKPRSTFARSYRLTLNERAAEVGGYRIDDLCRMWETTPARVYGAVKRGLLAPGNRIQGNLVVWDRAYINALGGFPSSVAA